MIAWLGANWPSLLVGLAVLALVVLCLWNLNLIPGKRRKTSSCAGCSGCSCGGACPGCASGSCPSKKE